MAQAAFFDVDGTLTRTSLFSSMGYYLMSQQTPVKGVLSLARELVRVPTLVAAEVLDRGAFNEQLFAAYRGFSVDRLELLADEVVDRVHMPALYAGARTLLQSCRDAGMTVVLISGSPDFLVRALGARLGVEPEDCFGNRLEFVRHVCTGRVLPPVLAGPRKAALVRDLAESRGWTLSQCHAYSDDSADAPMLAVVGHPAAVNPGARLRMMARTQRWPVVELQ